MIKKLVIAAVIGGLAVAAVKVTKYGRYVWHEITSTVRQAEEDIPLEKQIAMLEEKHRKLQSVALPKKIHELAVANKEYERLAGEVAVEEARQADTQKTLAARLDALKKANGQVTAGIPAGDTLGALEKDTAAWKAAQQVLAGRKATRDQSKANADVLAEQLTTLSKEIKDLGGQIQDMKVKLQQVRLQQMKSRHQTDNSDLAAAKKEAQEIANRIAVAEEEQRLTNQLDGIPTTQKPVAAPVPTKSLAALEADITGSPTAAPPAVQRAAD